jgi:RNA ligase
MKKHISMPSIEKFSNLVANINREYNFVGLDENNNPIYDNNKPKPVISLLGTIKLHGTNGGFIFNDQDGFWIQSKEKIITPENDNAGCAFFCETKKEAFMEIINKIKEKYSIDTSRYTICIYFEWVGKGIQKNVSVSNIEKSAFIFGIKIAKPDDKDFVNYWIDPSGFSSPENRIYNIRDYKTYSIDVDFNYPQLSINKIIEMTLEVEEKCPVGEAFGIEGIGEGLVFSFLTKNGKLMMMKSKGEKHAGKSKVKTLKSVDDEKINKIIDVVNKVTPQWRLEQMLEKQFDLINGGVIDVKQLGNYIRLVINDIIKEEMDVISEAGIEPNDINKYVSDVARKYFFQKENELLNL